MQLRSARLCMDCDDVHDQQQCPSCASETFAYITRWVPVPDRPQKRAQSLDVPNPETLSTYREMLQPDARRPSPWKTIRAGALGLALFGVAGWILRQKAGPGATSDRADDGTNPHRG